MSDSINRRNFLKLAALTGVAAGSGCGPAPTRELVSLTVPAEGAIPGVAAWYATTCLECPAGCGMTVRTREGRATKVEGNPQHPISKGGLCIRGQASLQGLYNPDRFQGPLRRGPGGGLEPLVWDEAEAILAERIQALRSSGQGGRIGFLSGQNGETLDQLIQQWMAALGSERYAVYEPFSYAAAIQEASRITFDRPEVPAYDLGRADYVLSFGADFLETWLNPVASSRAFAAMRELRDGSVAKIVQVEPRLSLTGANADEWVAIRPGTELWMALAMARHILANGLGRELPANETARLQAMLQPYSAERASAITDVPQQRIETLAAEFAAAQSAVAIGGGIAVTGENATATQVAIQLLNYVSGRIGQTVRYGRAALPPQPANVAALRGLIGAMNRGEVQILLVHHSNPLFTLPPHFGFAAALSKVPLVVSFSSFPDETTDLAHLVLPDHTPLEQWGDARPAAGVHSLVQPAMNPVFDTRAAADVLLHVAQRIGGAVATALPAASFQEHLKQRWRETYSGSAGDNFEFFWREALQHGGVWDTPSAEALGGARQAGQLRLSPQAFAFAFPQPPAQSAGEFFLHAYPSSRHYDGRGANKSWLHEIPDPITNVVWDSWVEVHPATAAQLGVREGDVLRVESDSGAVEAPVYVYEGVRPDTVAIPIGLGHASYGRYAAGVGVNPIALLPTVQDAYTGIQSWAGVRVKLSKTGRRQELVRTDGALTDEGRGFSQVTPLSELTAPQLSAETAPEPDPPSLYPPHEHKDYRWGMAINLSSCTGCNACVAACYAENNIPVVGKARVAEGRHMAWIRIERYIENISANPDIRFSPMLCQQCDNAPCEPVCPVFASVHSSDGLNLQVYNRCVGTRYCSNNCPYKVRVFNWFDYEFPAPLHLQLNPDVSVRGRGVMEKCTFCVQRIRDGKDHAKDEGRLARDGEVTPACAQSCPTKAIVFGNLLDENSAVSRAARTQHGYKVLEELNTLPAITYLPRVRRA